MTDHPSFFETFVGRIKAYAMAILLVFVIVLFLIATVMTFFYTGQRNQNRFLTDSYHQAQAQYNRTQQQLDGISFELEQKKNQLGQEQTKTKVLVGDNQLLKSLFDDQQSRFARTLKNLEIKVKDLQSIANFRVETTGQFVTITKDSITNHYVPGKRKEDTVRQVIQVINFQEPNGWFTMSGTIRGDTMNFKPTFREEYDLAVFQQRRTKKYFFDWFPGKETVGEIVNHNPYSSTKSLKLVAKQPRRRFLGIF
jgi:hypothetical protein